MAPYYTFYILVFLFLFVGIFQYFISNTLGLCIFTILVKIRWSRCHGWSVQKRNRRKVQLHFLFELAGLFLYSFADTIRNRGTNREDVNTCLANASMNVYGWTRFSVFGSNKSSRLMLRVLFIKRFQYSEMILSSLFSMWIQNWFGKLPKARYLQPPLWTDPRPTRKCVPVLHW